MFEEAAIARKDSSVSGKSDHATEKREPYSRTVGGCSEWNVRSFLLVYRPCLLFSRL